MTYRLVQTVDYPLIKADAQVYEKLDIQRVKRVCKNDEDYILECGEADAIIISGMTVLKGEVISRFNRCRIIAVIGSGYQLDIKTATQKGICVVNVPDYCLDEVSDHTMALILACSRKMKQLSEAVDQNHWDSVARPVIRNKIWPGMVSLRGLTLGLVGVGKIGRTVVPKAMGFGMKVLGYVPFVSPDRERIQGVTMCDLDELVKKSDYVSLHCPLVDSTYHLFDAPLIAKMKPTAHIINTSRGPLIDESALYNAIIKGELAGAGLDVLEQEDPPDPENPLLRLPQVIVTAHSAHYSDTAMDKLKRRPDEEICRLFSGKWPHGLLNSEVKNTYQNKWGYLESQPDK